MKRLILCFIFSFSCYVYGENHQSLSLSWRPALDTRGDFEPLKAGLEYTQQIDAFKWGIGLEYLRDDVYNTMLLSLQGAWVFSKTKPVKASLGIRLGAELTKNYHESILLYTSPFISFEYFFNETFSFFVALQINVDPTEIPGIFKKGKGMWIVAFEVPIGVSFHF